MADSTISLRGSDPRHSALGPDTIVDTEDGPLPLEWVVAGHRLLTRDRGAMPVLWTTSTRPEALAEDGTPVLIPEGALGFGEPCDPVVVAPRHRILLRHPAAELYFAAPEVLVEARDLLGLNGIGPAENGPDFAFIHIGLSHPAVFECCGLASVALGVAMEASPCPVLDPAEARLMRETLAAPLAEVVRRAG